MKPRRCVLFACAGAVAAVARSAWSQPQSGGAAGYPSRPIRMIVPSAPGCPADIVGRLVSQGLSPVLGQQVVIDCATPESGEPLIKCVLSLRGTT